MRPVRYRRVCYVFLLSAGKNENSQEYSLYWETLSNKMEWRDFKSRFLNMTWKQSILTRWMRFIQSAGKITNWPENSPFSQVTALYNIDQQDYNITWKQSILTGCMRYTLSTSKISIWPEISQFSPGDCAIKHQSAKLHSHLKSVNSRQVTAPYNISQQDYNLTWKQSIRTR